MTSTDPIVAHLLNLRSQYSALAQRGFPIIDGIYWDWPSPGIGAAFLMELKASRQLHDFTVIDLRPPARPARPIRDVISELEAEHRDGYWYRGQTRRHECQYRGTVPRMENTAPGINPIHVLLDAVVPSTFRAYTRAKPAQWDQFHLAPPLDYIAGPCRAIFASRDRPLGELLLSAIDFMLIDAIRLGQTGKARITLAAHMLAPGSTVAKEVLDLISIAQHYEYGSLMVDVSTSIDASVWFATREWKTGKMVGGRDGSPGVIYRVDAKKIEGILDRHISGPGAMAPPASQAMGIFGLADIRHRFTFLDRPRSQHGGSLLGMENVVTHFLMHINEAIEAFPFDHSSVTGSETTYSRDTICPPSDRGVEIFRPERQYSADPLLVSELADFLTWMDVESPKAQHYLGMRKAGVI
ncbi:MAG: hypothetical protein JSS04_05065 [Proteobacteria bacterium]|nr:hypothetical protein [Pseudomonadota bacterium]